MANDNLLAFQKEADALAKAGKKIHPSLQEDLKESQERLAKLQQDLEKSQDRKGQPWMRVTMPTRRVTRN